MTIAIYAREEKCHRKEELDYQVGYCEEFVEAKKLKVAKKNIFSDLGVVESLEEPSALRELMTACRSGEIKAIIIEDHHILADSSELEKEIDEELDKLNVIVLPVKCFPEHDPCIQEHPEFAEDIDEEYLSVLRAKVKELGGVS